MGGRVDGKKKKKSTKANVTSRFSSKRKLSRMGKKVKKGKAGAITEFMTRSAALRKLQITLKDFRRLCILKGIYPRVPNKAPKGADKVYYDIKDIGYVMHEPLLDKFREFKSFMKKIRRAAGRNQFEEARRKNDLKPKISLDHLVKERYPRFIDALRDLDDALCMIHLFAMLPSSGRVIPERSIACNRLAREWQYYVSKSRTLRKVFVSVKGVYYQAEIMGEPINWLVPHPFTQTIPKEVDFRVMLTFLEFYEVFVKFVMFKLFHTQGWQYPPVIDQKLDSQGSCLLALRSETIPGQITNGEQEPMEVEAVAVAVVEEPEKTKKSKKPDAKLAKKLATLPSVIDALNPDEEDDEEDEYTGDLAAPLQQAFSDLQNFLPSTSASKEDSAVEDATFGTDLLLQNTTLTEAQQSLHQTTSLFSKLVFFLNREVPLDWLQLCTTAFGGTVGWDGPGSAFTVDDPRITHHVIDRPVQGDATHPHREYVQPQWIFDSVNVKLLLPTRLYAPGATLPPHLSPFVDDDREGYVPSYRAQIKKLQEEREGKTKDEDNKEENKAASATTNQEEDQEEEEDYAETVRKERSKKKGEQQNNNDSEEEESAVEEEDDDSEEEQEVEEIEEVPVAKGHQKKGPKAIVFRAPAEQVKVDEKTEIQELSKQMMTKKTKRLYDRMQHGIAQKQDAIQTLESKRKALEVESNPNSNNNAQQQKKAKKSKKA